MMLSRWLHKNCLVALNTCYESRAHYQAETWNLGNRLANTLPLWTAGLIALFGAVVGILVGLAL